MTNKFFALGLCTLLGAYGANAQFADDALRFSEITTNGTARFQGIGGGHTALGGDASAIVSNPAGLGYYSRSEITLTPGYDQINANARYLGETGTDSKGNFNLGNASLVIASERPQYQTSGWRSVMGVSYNRQQSLQRRFAFSGYNQNSAFIDYIVESANANAYTENELGASTTDPITGDPRYDLLEGVYFNLYAFDPVSGNQPPYVAAEPESAVEQSGFYDYRGSHAQWTFAYSGNYQDKLYLGISVGFTRTNSKMDRVLDERYVKGQVFSGTSYWEGVDVTGNGFNATIGAIYKITPDFHLGAQVSSPTFSKFKRSLYEGASVDPIVNNPSFPNSLSTTPWDFDYSQLGPFRGSVGGTWFYPGKLGFVTASLDFVGYKGMNVKSVYGQSRADEEMMDYETGNIRAWYKNVVNPRIGTEVRLGEFRARAGVAYSMDPYEAKLINIKEDRIHVSGGLGYRGNKFFTDLAVVYGTYKVPFELYGSLSEPGTATYHNVRGVLTLGFNF